MGRKKKVVEDMDPIEEAKVVERKKFPVRSGAGTNFKIIGLISEKDNFEIKGSEGVYHIIEVVIDGKLQKGYVKKSFI